VIATNRTIGFRGLPAPAVGDPRRSYDRGVWTATEPVDVGAAPEPDLGSIPVEALRRELERRQRRLEALSARRAAIADEIAALDALIEAAERPAGPQPGTSPRRHQPARLEIPLPKNALSLPDAAALEAEPGAIVTPAEIARRVLASGYQTASKRFIAQVTHAMSADGRFRRVDRGRYERVPG